MNNERVLVTGGCGFVGSSLCSRLVQEGYRVAVIDDLSVGSALNLTASTRAGVELIASDIRNQDTVRRCLEYFKPAIVYHLAAIHYIPACDADPLRCIEVNVTGTQALLDACQATPSVQTVIFTSSGAVYQPSSQAHVEDNALAPVDIYGYSKLWGEQLLDLFHQRTGISVGIARLFNVFGPGETNPHFIPALLQQLQHGDELLVGDLSTQRDYIYVEDVAAALLALAAAAKRHGKLICNVGSESQTAGATLVDLLTRLTERHLLVRSDASRLRKIDRPFLLSDCRRAHTLLGWSACTSLEVGLQSLLGES